LFEPINTLMHALDPRLFFGYDVRPIAAITAKLEAQFRRYQPDRDPMTDFDRDLVRLAEQAGFAEVSLDLQVSVKSSRTPCPWDRFPRMSGNPLIPSLANLLDEALTGQEKADFTAHLRPLVEAGTGKDRRAVAYLAASGSGGPAR
jgi:arsenite methyltransferase